jgi:hypothetical protein
MGVKIPRDQIQNYQQLEVVVAGRDDTKRLFIIDGQFDVRLTASAHGNSVTEKETFSVLVGPVFGKKQFLQANGIASITKTSYEITPSVALPNAQSRAQWQVLGVDADWDDESGQVELRIEAEVECLGAWDSSAIDGFSFHVTILAAA